MKRVVITGMGALSPIGNNLQEFWDSLINGKSGAANIQHFDASLFRTRFACELKNFNASQWLDKAVLRKTDPFTQYALVAAAQAITDSGLDFSKMDPFDSGVIWGSGQGGMLTFEEQVTEYVTGNYQPRFSPYFVPKLITNMAAGMISIQYGLMGINYTTVSACATTNTAIMDALTYIRLGKAKVIVTGGSEAPITPASVGGFCAMKAMSARNDDPATASRPFDVNRDGFVMGEGAGALILEEYEHAKARGAKIYAEVAGAAMTADAYHMTATHPEGLGARRAMEFALKDAGLNKEDVNYLNAHATSTPVGDLSEIHAISTLFGAAPGHLHISATKSMTGHLLGAAGAVEAIASVLSIKNGIIPPTINTETLDAEIPAGMPIVLKTAIEKPVNVAMSNTFGFGGHNGIVIFKKI
ncbi:3-oxoacyl-[acyl-carrier-protein] synthase II [Chitinophaga terrae (ex Kim and Jung 2007)]|uniref:3-oxoacyl-[acyl-carrier-protein] synthase 2 n=1 Tax=Chitinophaga terrae (ex Kim and Jung 2007) TaxID=408074 RepID=A0A1H4CI25_9BACT|nr:beta-ketoacyl-ACP synthase II [Chitinophaga terrae (ex Kim and Jung 2007)]GEP88988.1 3-oxoacyl-[acyl-carrier-protein] synthase 2 [Chitinophaga terrae (ex Kim and Jung 2007)]SEA59973.1 3-oxoacyl-[acyl-carrier-protein] synthase II [Chitinophaga terrae (ex Kim and Jung 2007)]